jgi:predicted ATPase
LQSETPPKIASFPVEELPFTDRIIELRRLETCIKQIGQSAQGAILLVSGEPGIGKTRLCQEAKKFAQSKNYRWLSAKCTRGEDLAPYSPWIQLLREFASQASIQLFYKVSGPYLNEIVKLIPELAENSGTTASSYRTVPASAEEVTQRRLQFFQSLTQFFTRLSKESPLVLFFDDLQWADPATIQLLKFFRASALSNTPILILTSHRDFEVAIGENPSVSSFLKELENDRKYIRIHLQRFDDINVGELLARTSGGQEISNEFKQLIYLKTGGNPFFIEEILRSLLEKGEIFRNDKGLWDRKDISEIDVPRSIQELIRQRIQRLDEETREILKIASVIGEVFEIGTVGKVAGRIAVAGRFSDSGSVTRAVGKAQAAGFVRKMRSERIQIEEQNEIFTFSDESVHDVLYEELNASSQRELHLVTAKALEQLFSKSVTSHHEFPSELAFHFLRGGDQAKTLEYSIKAGERAAGLFAHEEASKQYKLALEIMNYSDHDSTTEATISSKLGDEYWLMGDLACLDNWRRAGEICERKTMQENLASDVYRKMAFVYNTWLADKEGT